MARQTAIEVSGKNVALAAAQTVNRGLLIATLGVSIAAAMIFMALAIKADLRPQAVSSVAFGATLFCCSLCSLLYHLSEQWSLRQMLRLLDHSAIFLLIAGTYTPFTISGIAGPFGWPLLDWIWGLAILGVAARLLFHNRFQRLFILLYLMLGWLFILALPELIEKTAILPLALLITGGIAYSLGALCYWRLSSDWTDSIWHGFVLAGILLHIGAVLSLVLATSGIPGRSMALL
jgi:hemolysin III